MKSRLAISQSHRGDVVFASIRVVFIELDGLLKRKHHIWNETSSLSSRFQCSLRCSDQIWKTPALPHPIDGQVPAKLAIRNVFRDSLFWRSFLQSSNVFHYQFFLHQVREGRLFCLGNSCNGEMPHPFHEKCPSLPEKTQVETERKELSWSSCESCILMKGLRQSVCSAYPHIVYCPSSGMTSHSSELC